MLNVPLPVTSEVTSISYQVSLTTEPRLPRLAPSMAGLLFQVVPVSDHVVLVIALNVPPVLLPLLPLMVRMRSLALVTGSVSPLTVNFRNDWRTGELSTTNWAEVP